MFTMTKAPEGNELIQENRTSKYLLETRSKYINMNNFYGSDYFLNRIGYDESKDWEMHIMNIFW